MPEKVYHPMLFLVDALLLMAGPGSYELRGMADTSVPASSSVFKSKTTRAADHVVTVATGAPGPAYYAPASPDRRSHLLNANKKWL